MRQFTSLNLLPVLDVMQKVNIEAEQEAAQRKIKSENDSYNHKCRGNNKCDASTQFNGPEQVIQFPSKKILDKVLSSAKSPVPSVRTKLPQGPKNDLSGDQSDGEG